MNRTFTTVLLLFFGFLQHCFGGGVRSGSDIFSKKVYFPTTLNSVVVFSENFAGGLPGNWSSVDNTGSGIRWKYTTTGIYRQGVYPGYDSLSSLGTTARNGYMIFDSDSSQNNLGPEEGELISPMINCSGFPKVRIAFHQLLIHKNEIATVSVSSDGNTFAIVYEASASLIPNQPTSNPDFVDIDISTIAANEATVYIKFSFSGQNDFFWMIDDISVYFPETDAAIGVVSPVTNCALLSSAETVKISVFNNGDESITHFPVSYQLDSGTVYTETFSDTIQPGGNAEFTFTALADISLPGLHILTAYVSLSGDTTFVNDTVRARIYSGPHTVDAAQSYENGFENADEISGIGIEDANNDGTVWNLTAQTAHSGDFSASFTGARGNDWLYTTCLDLQPNIQYLLTYFYLNADTNSISSLEVRFGDQQAASYMTSFLNVIPYMNNAVYLQDSIYFSVNNAGTYYIGFHAINSDSTAHVQLDDINISANGILFGIEKNKTNSYSVYPNPSSGIVRISSTVPINEEYKIIIRNSIGQIILTNPYANTTTKEIDIRNSGAGLYLLEIKSNTGKTEYKTKIIIQ